MREDEASRVFHWRCDQLRVGGFDPEAAVLIADSDTDLHEACDLLKALVAADDDNPVATALRILL